MLYLPCGYDLKANAGVTAAFFCSVLSGKCMSLWLNIFLKKKKNEKWSFGINFPPLMTRSLQAPWSVFF